MAIKTIVEQIESVQAAIERIEGGAQSWSLDQAKVMEAQLSTLYRREAELLSRRRGVGRLLLNLRDSGSQDRDC